MADRIRPGDSVLITAGPFEGRVGTVTSMDDRMATVIVDVFGRGIRVEVEIADLRS